MTTLADMTLEELRARALFFGVRANKNWREPYCDDGRWRLELLGTRDKHLILKKYPAWFDSEREALCAYLSEMKAHHYPDRLPDTVTA